MPRKTNMTMENQSFESMYLLLEITLPETNGSHLKMDGWNTRFLLGWPIFRGVCC